MSEETQTKAVAYLKGLGLSQEALAEKIESSQATVGRVLRGHRPSLEFVDKARNVGCDPTWWFQPASDQVA